MNFPISATRVIVRKRDGGAHPAGEIEWMISEFIAGRVTDYQMTAWMMAIYFQGMTAGETVRLTRAMRETGEPLAPWPEGPPAVDKHSTGGVGDKVSLIVAPLVAACGLRVPMISGRSLGHTGGTLDKLESIPGYRVDLSAQEFRRAVGAAGASIAGATDSLAPADRRMYALRDVSGIVPSVPLIVSSILSKKLAARLDGLVFDVKVGSGGFMPRAEGARDLAGALCRVAGEMGLRAEALLTAMDAPLGRAIGNSLEVKEAIDFLRGEPASDGLRSVSMEIAAAMMRVAGVEEGGAIAGALENALTSGAGLERFKTMVAAHGGDPRVVDHPERLPRAPRRHSVRAIESGWIERIDARTIGELSLDLGGGRLKAGESIDPRVGVVLEARVGDRIAAGEVLATLHMAEGSSVGPFEQIAARAFRIAPDRGQESPPVLERVSFENGVAP